MPCDPVVVLPVAEGEGGYVLDFTGDGAAGPGVVGDLAADGGGFKVADVFPAEVVLRSVRSRVSRV